MTTLTEGRHAAGFLLSEAPGTRSRDNLLIGASQTITPGTLLGKVAAGDGGGGTQTVAAAVAAAGNTGTGTVGSLTGDAHAPAGIWTLLCIEPGTNAGKFEVQRPDGTVEGVATVAVAYNGALNFTISDATDFISGDAFTIAVSYADPAHAGEYKAWAADAVDGTQNAIAIALYGVTTAVSETATIAAITCDAEVNGNLLEAPYGADDDDDAAAVATLSAVGIKIR